MKAKSRKASLSLEEDARSPIRKVRITPGKCETSELAQGCFEDLWKHMGGHVTLDETRRYYDLMSCHFDEDMAEQKYNGPQIMLDKILELGVSKDAHILDVGCGSGLLGAALSRNGFTTFDGVDMSEEMLRQTNKKAIYTNTQQCTVEPETDLSAVTSTQYDLICLLSSLQPGHVSPLALENLSGLLKPGGYLIWARSASIPHKHLVGAFARRDWQKVKSNLAKKGLAEREEGFVDNFHKDKSGVYGIFTKS